MKKLLLIISFIFMTTFSCTESNKITYRLHTITVIPDSLQQEHREFVIQLVKAASYNMTGGDYEDVDDTIIQAKLTADELFGKEVIALRKYPNDEYYHDVIILQKDLNEVDRKIFDSLMVGIKIK